MTLVAGTKLGPYEILSPLGAGGMGEVYRAKDARLGREVAVKVLPADFAADAERRRRFEQEARAASALNHPNIVSIYDIGTDKGVGYMAMELIEGRSLRDLADSGPVSPRRVLEIAAPLADGLARAHAAGIVHRDLKPENVMISKDGFVKILDFGLAKAAPVAESGGSQMPTMGPATGAGTVLGTVAYMSPEQASGRPIDHRSDQFSFATILHELLSGKKPFLKATAVETMSAIIREDTPPLAQSGVTVPAPLRWILDRCHAKDPDGRYASTLDLARELKSLRDHYSELSSVSGIGAPASEAPARSGIGAREMAALAAALLVGAAVVWLLRGPTPPPTPVRIRALTYSGHDTMPATSPDGKTVVFASDRDGQFRIWIRQLGTGGEAPVTEGIDLSPRFFPDGQSILYAHAEKDSRSLYRMALVGGQPRRLIENADQGDVSPDGGRIAFIRVENDRGRTVSSLSVARPDGGEVSQIFSDADRQLVVPRFSPDGRTIAVIHQGQAGTRGEIGLVSLDGALPRTVKAPLPNGAISSPLWSRDGQSLYFIQADSSLGGAVSTEGHLVRCDVRTGRSSLLLWTPVTATTIAQAGDRLILDGAMSRENLKAISLSASGATEPRWLTRGLIVDRQPAPGPDGDRVIFSSSRNGNQDIWSISLKTGAASSLTDDPADDWDPQLTPDGLHLLWSSNRSGSFEIWIADADGGHPRQVTHDGDAENPTATPDGRWIVYASGTATNEGIWKIRADGTQATRLASGYLLNPEVSPDGSYAAYRVMVIGRSRALVKVLRLSDGATLPFEIEAPDVGFGGSGRVRWMRGGKALAYIASDEHGIQGIYAQDFVPGTDTSATRRRLGGFDREAPVESFGITHDDVTLVIAGLDQSFNLMMMEHVPGFEDRR